MEMDKFLKETLKKYGAGEDGAWYVDLSRPEARDFEVLSTGSLQVDHLTGLGGIPRGRITMIHGPAGAGKTSFCYGLMRAAQRQGLAVAYFDIEYAANPAWMERQGVDLRPDRLVYMRPEVGEVALDILVDCVRSGLFGLVVVDSLHALTTRAEIALKSIEDQKMAGTANIITRCVKRTKGAVSATNTALVLINQERQKIGPYPGIALPGGDSPKFYCSLIMRIKKGEKLAEGKEELGFMSEVEITKNRFAALRKKPYPEILIKADGGVSLAHDIVKAGESSGVLRKNGAHYYYGERRIAFGEQALIDLLEEETALAEEIASAIRESWV